MNNPNSAPLSFYDVNGDGYVDTTDINLLRYGSAERRIVMLNENDVKFRLQRINNTNGSRF